MTPSELAYVIESSPPHERKIIWDLIQLDTEGEVWVNLMKIFVKIYSQA